jgi:hypothetical protein
MARASSIFSSRNARPLVPVLAAFGLFCVIEYVLAVLFPDSRMVEVAKATAVAIETHETPEIMVLGDSVSLGSIWSVEIEDVLGGQTKVANYSIPGINPVTSYYLLRRQIKTGNVPRTILYAHSAHTFSEDTRIAQQVGAFNNLEETIDLYRSAYDPYELLYGTLSRWSYTIRYRSSFRDLLTRGDVSFFTRTRLGVDFGQARLERYLANDDLFSQINSGGLPQPPPRILFRTFDIADSKQIYLHRTIELAQANDIRIAWVSMPMPESTYAIRSQNGFVESYYAQLDALVDKSHLEYLQRDILVLPDSEFRDYWHLQARTGITFSRHLGELLNSQGLENTVRPNPL